MIDTQTETKEVHYWVVGLLSKLGSKVGIAVNEEKDLNVTMLKK